jgi:hypothetical protein
LPGAPKRAGRLEINRVEDGFMIYQAARDRVHYLNHTAVLILELCDGRHSAADIASLVRKAYGLAAAPRREVDSTLATLTHEGLVKGTRIDGRTASGRRAGRRRP